MASTLSGMTELISRFGDSHGSCWEAKPGLSPKRLSRRITFGAKVDGIGLAPTAQSPSFHRNKCFTALPEGVALTRQTMLYKNPEGVALCQPRVK